MLLNAQFFGLFFQIKIFLYFSQQTNIFLCIYPYNYEDFVHPYQITKQIVVALNMLWTQY